ALTLVLVVQELARAPQSGWNDYRLARAGALAYGYDLYPGADEGPVLGYIYPPMTAVAFAPASLVPHPTYAIVVGVATAWLLYSVPFVLLLYGASRGTGRLALLLFLIFTLMTLHSRVLYPAGFRIHADAPALGFGALACFFVQTSERRTTVGSLAASAVAATLSVLSKQVMVFLPVALAGWIWTCDGTKAAARYAALLAAGGAVAGLLVVWAFDLDGLLFNAITVPASHPWQGGTTLEAIERALRDLVPRAFAPAVVTAAAFASEVFSAAGRRRTFRSWLRENPWLLLAWVAALSVPTSVLGRVKVGGSLNTLAYTLYFLIAAALVAALRQAAVRRLASAIEAGALVFAAATSALLAPRLAELAADFRAFPRNRETVAFEYVRDNPGEVYVPFRPLVNLIAEGRLYHLSQGISDRELADRRVSEELLRAHLPPKMRLLLVEEPDDPILRRLPEYSVRVEERRLPGWIVLRRR
ncbi:MAG: hypothetical protein ACREQ9_21075, partial [Candidatus Binatia bacterium]